MIPIVLATSVVMTGGSVVVTASVVVVTASAVVVVVTSVVVVTTSVMVVGTVVSEMVVAATVGTSVVWWMVGEIKTRRGKCKKLLLKDTMISILWLCQLFVEAKHASM